jgi:hypothetical protein
MPCYRSIQRHNWQAPALTDDDTCQFTCHSAWIDYKTKIMRAKQDIHLPTSIAPTSDSVHSGRQ